MFCIYFYLPSLSLLASNYSGVRSNHPSPTLFATHFDDDTKSAVAGSERSEQPGSGVGVGGGEEEWENKKNISVISLKTLKWKIPSKSARHLRSPFAEMWAERLLNSIQIAQAIVLHSLPWRVRFNHVLVHFFPLEMGTALMKVFCNKRSGGFRKTSMFLLALRSFN